MKIKKTAEDFIVKEIISLDNKKGNYVYKLTKKNYTTPQAIRIIEKITGKKVKFCGNKDKIAITEQYISCKEKFTDIFYGDKNDWLKTEYYGENSQPLSLGSHLGNYFEIKVSDYHIEDFDKEEFAFPNYFGEQRFSKNNVLIGNLLLERNFSKALELIGDNNANSHLLDNPNDFIGALKKIPAKIVRLYLASVQSYAFNQQLSEQIVGKKLLVADQKLNFGTPKASSIKLIGWENDRRFLFREYPEISLEGEYRNVLTIARNISSSNNTIKFSLDKSSYATIFLRSLLLEDINY